MKPAAHVPEKFFAAAKQREFAGREKPSGDQLVGVADAVDVFGDPEEGIEVAQSSFALLDVGLNEIARRPRLPYPGFALRELGGDERGRRLGDDLLVETGPERLEQRLVASDEPSFEERCADGHVGAGLFQALIDGPRRVSDLELEIPEHIEQRLDHLLHPRRGLVGHEEQDDRRPKRARACRGHSRRPRRSLATADRTARGSASARTFRARRARIRRCRHSASRRMRGRFRRPPEPGAPSPVRSSRLFAKSRLRRGGTPRRRPNAAHGAPRSPRTAWLARRPWTRTMRRAERGAAVPPRKQGRLTSAVYPPSVRRPQGQMKPVSRYFFVILASIASQIATARSGPPSFLTARIPVGEVTLISVR